MSVGDYEFRERVLQSLARLETKMDGLVGVDGNNGRMGNAEERIDELQERANKQKGFLAAVSVGASLIGIAIDHFMSKVR